MNYYKIVMYNKKENLWNKETVIKHTFPEAVMIAYTTRNVMGYEWEIISIKKQGGKNG